MYLGGSISKVLSRLPDRALIGPCSEIDFTRMGLVCTLGYSDNRYPFARFVISTVIPKYEHAKIRTYAVAACWDTSILQPLCMQLAIGIHCRVHTLVIITRKSPDLNGLLPPGADPSPLNPLKFNHLTQWGIAWRNYFQDLCGTYLIFHKVKDYLGFTLDTSNCAPFFQRPDF